MIVINNHNKLFIRIGTMSTIYFVISCLCLSFVFVLIKFLKKLWWTPNRVQKLMFSQGIKGPSYRFLHGTTKELIRMRNEAMNTPMELSHDILSTVMPHTCSWMKIYGTSFLNWIGPQAQLVITDPELIKVVLNDREGAYPKSDNLGIASKLLGDGLVTSQGEKWRKQRKLANHAFHADSLKAMSPAMIASVEMMLEKWRSHIAGNKEIEVFQEFKLLASEVISRTAFGSSYLEGEHIFDMLMKMAAIVYKNAYKVRIPGIEKLVKSRDDVESDRLEIGIRDSMMKLIRKREERVLRGEAENFGSDFLGLLVSAYHSDDSSKKISVDDMIDECKTFYLAGQETTSSLLCWTVFLLSIHKDWQHKAREEVLQLFGKAIPNSSPHGIARLTNMGMIINESLRLYSPVSTVVRKTNRDIRLGELIVPADMEVSIPSLALHHNPKIWGTNALMFKPERFAEGVAKATNNNVAAYLPFGLGPRTCVGLNFAVNETKIALSMILQRYEFTLSPNYVHSPVQLLTVSPQHGLQIILRHL